MPRGTLRIYLGAAPGVGKTYDMLGEAHQLLERGTDAVVGFVECHGRARTEALLNGLEIIPRRELAYRGAAFTEMDTDAVIARNPSVALVDELAHTNVPGSRNTKRWQDIGELLDAGINVVSTLNIQHLESVGDVVEAITGVRQRETVPDDWVRRADQIELVDIDPETLRRRLAQGDVYAADRIDAALSHYFRPGNLTALRELALLWTADRVDAYLQRYRAEKGITDTWGARERIVVGLTGGPEGRTLIRRAARIAAKGSGSEVLAVHVMTGDGLTVTPPGEIAAQRRLVEDLGGTFHAVLGEDTSDALLDFARGVNATQVVLGTSRRRPWQHVFGPGVGALVARHAGPDLDVLIVTHEHAAKGRGLPIARGARLGRSRVAAGWLVGLLGPALLALVLAAAGPGLGFAGEILLFLTLTVLAALLGGLLPALAAAAAGSLLLNIYFTEPHHTVLIDTPQHVLTIAIFVLVGVAVASVVDLAARRSQQAARLRADAETLASLAGGVLRGEDALPALLERVRMTFDMESAALLERTDGTGRWDVVASVGPSAVSHPDQADVDVSAGDRLALALSGRTLPAGDRRVLGAFADRAAAVLDHQRLAEEAQRARSLAEADRVRTSLLTAVSRDLSTPLSSVRAAVAALRSDAAGSAPGPATDRAALLADIEESADHLARLVGNLRDMSRLLTGSVTPVLVDAALSDVVPHALTGVPDGRVVLDLPAALPLVRADPVLLERAVANIVANAVVSHPDGQPVRIAASSLGGEVELRFMDRGRGVPDESKEEIFEPFQRHGEAPRGDGVELGLAVARGFTEAMGGALAAEDTPGGGLTMVLTLPAGGPGQPAAEGSPDPTTAEP